MKKRADTIGVVVIVVAMVAVLAWVVVSDNMAVNQAERFAAGVKRGEIFEITGDISQPNGQEFSLTAEGAVARASEVQLYGIVSVTPPLPDCTLIGINRMQDSLISPSWKCGTVLITQDFTLRLANPPAWPQGSISGAYVRIIPTGVTQK